MSQHTTYNQPSKARADATLFATPTIYTQRHLSILGFTWQRAFTLRVTILLSSMIMKINPSLSIVYAFSLFSHTQHYFCNIETVAFFDKATQSLGGIKKKDAVSTWDPFLVKRRDNLSVPPAPDIIWDCRCLFLRGCLCCLCVCNQNFNITRAACHVGNVRRTQRLILRCLFNIT